MVAGHLREQNGKFQMILSWKGEDGKRRTKSISTGLPVKGNKRRAEEMLRVTCETFDPENTIDRSNTLVSDFLLKWLKDTSKSMTPNQYANYAYNVKSYMVPYFSAEETKLSQLTGECLKHFFSIEKNEKRTSTSALVEYHEIMMVAFNYAVEIGWINENPAEKVNPCEDDSQLLFTSFLLDWLAMMRSSVSIPTHSGYSKAIKNKIIPYFDQHYPGLKLSHVTPKHIQDYYTYELTVNKLSPNTILRRQANIRKALQYAFRTELITGNPADKIERPKAEKFTSNFYQMDELEHLFEVFKGDALELEVIMAAFYGLRRSEILGLRWDDVDFERKTITICHTVHQIYDDGKMKVVALDRTKTKSSYRTLPLVGPIEKLLIEEKARLEENRKLCGTFYCLDYTEYIFVNEIGELVKPDFVSRHFALIIKKHNLRKLRFHDLRHSCASLLFANGVSMKDIQVWLGHSTLATTANIYTHMDEDKKIASATAIMPLLKS